MQKNGASLQRDDAAGATSAVFLAEIEREARAVLVEKKVILTV